MATDNGTSASWYVMFFGQKRVFRADSFKLICMQTPFAQFGMGKPDHVILLLTACTFVLLVVSVGYYSYNWVCLDVFSC